MAKNILCLDIGGTNPRMIMVKSCDDGSYDLIGDPFMISKDVDSIIPQINSYLGTMGEHGITTDTCCACVAGEIINNKLNTAANVSFSVDGHEIKEKTMLENVLLINDFKAIAEGICSYNLDRDVARVNSADEIKANESGAKLFQLPLNGEFADGMKYTDMAVLGPGTGLGVAYMVANDGDYITKSSEGGHGGFGIPSKYSKLAAYIEELNGSTNLGMEAFVSGTAIGNIIQFLVKDDSFNEMKESFEEELSDKELKVNLETMDAKDIPAFVSMNQKKNATCKLAMNLFLEFLAIASSSVAVHGLSTGGLFLAGGVPPKNLDLFFDGDFMSQFVKNWRKEELLKSIPVYMVKDYNISFYGCAHAAAKTFN